MKNISLSLNVVLLLAVGFLYYKQFSGQSTSANETATAQDSVTSLPPIEVMSNMPGNKSVVYINADSIFANYAFAKKSKAAIEQKVANYQRSYQTKVDAFQAEYSDYMEKAGAGAYSKEQGMAIEAGLQKKRDDIMLMEQNQEKVMGDMEGANSDVQKTIYEYIRRFNQKHGYDCVLAYTIGGGGVLGVNDSLDVTKQVLAGLNAEYKAVKK